MERELRRRYFGYKVVLGLIGLVVIIIGAVATIWFLLQPADLKIGEKVELRDGYLIPSASSGSIEVGSQYPFKLTSENGITMQGQKDQKFEPPFGLEEVEHYVLFISGFSGKWKLESKEATVMIRDTPSATLYPSERSIVIFVTAVLFFTALLFVGWVSGSSIIFDAVLEWKIRNPARAKQAK